MDPNQLVELITAKKWFVLAAVVIGLVVRLLKSDTKLPIDVPPRWRFWLAIGLGLAAGVLDAVFEKGVTWQAAILQGLAAAAAAILGHNAIVDSLRGGRELPIPGVVIPGKAPSPGKPPSIPPNPPKTGAILGLLAILGLSAIAGGANACRPVDPSTKQQALTVLQLACIAANAFLPDQKTVMHACRIADVLAPEVADLIAAQHKAAAARGGKYGAATDAPVCVQDDHLAACAP